MNAVWYCALIVTAIAAIAGVLLSVSRRRRREATHADSDEVLDCLQIDGHALHEGTTTPPAHPNYPAFGSALRNPTGHQSLHVQDDERQPDPDQEYKGD